jgi:hypothetical protein
VLVHRWLKSLIRKLARNSLLTDVEASSTMSVVIPAWNKKGYSDRVAEPQFRHPSIASQTNAVGAVTPEISSR